ncbi:MAG: ABC transporter ATP-binding protein [Bacteroidota bacterium]
MLQSENLSYSYDKRIQLRFPNIQCARGEQCLLIGQSGSGKTTLLHLLAGLRRPRSGSIYINEQDITEFSPAQLDYFRGKHIGIIFQQAHFVRALDVAENLALAQRLSGGTEDYPAIVNLLEQLNLGHKLKANTNELSVGEQQRVAIARALINQPSVIFADEPTSALDDKNTEQVIELLKQQASKANASLLIVTHDNRLKSVFEKTVELVD